MNDQKIVALSYTKQRTMFGMVGVEVDSSKKTAHVRLAKQWSRDEMNRMPADIKEVYDKVKWDMTFADQQIGQHMIRSVENALQFEVQTITTQKNLKDPEDIEAIKVMDMTEMVQLTLSLLQGHRIQFPPVEELVKDLKKMANQMEMFTEHVTEAGTVAYYAPGEELDCLPKALMICLFAARTSLQHGEMPMIVLRGTPEAQTADESFQDLLEKIGMGGSDSLSEYGLNTMSRKRLFRPRNDIF